MRLLPLALLFLGLSGCAGNVADYVGNRTGIIAPQLVRFGLDETQTQCVGTQLADALTPLQLRRLTRLAGAVPDEYPGPGRRLALSDLMHVASTMRDPQVRLELARATEGCGIGTQLPAGPGSAPATPSVEAGASGGGTRPAEWLNLGAAPTGQSIAVDAATLEREPTARKAWFRLTNPNEVEPTGISYLLRIDCTARTIEAIAQRRQDAAGAISDFHEYVRDPQGPMPIEGGTVMEIAYLALCT